MDLEIINQIRNAFVNLPAPRKAGNREYAMKDAALSTFSVFITQSPSFLDYQLRL